MMAIQNHSNVLSNREHADPADSKTEYPKPVACSPAGRRSEHFGSFTTSDQQQIFYRYWKPNRPSNKAVLLFHRGHEHSGRWNEMVAACDRDDVWFFAWDARGHGETTGVRGAAPSFARMVADADEFAAHLVANHGIELKSTAVVGQSVGAVLAATWVHDYAPPIAAMVLATPALRIKLYVPAAIPALRVLKKLRRRASINSYVRPSMLTRDVEQANAYANDPLISPKIAVNVLLDVHDTSTRLMQDAAAITTPTLMWVSGKDFVVRQDVQHQFFDRLASQDKHIEVLPGGYHSTFWDKDREPVIERSLAFALDRIDANVPVGDLDSDSLSVGSQKAFQDLQTPASPIGRCQFAIQRWVLNTVGRLSEGVRIGWKDGFDSGQSLDHVYRNEAKGTTPLGRMIDRVYLNSIGWKGIRRRKVHMETLLDEAIEQALKQHDHVTILDIAAGPGRYVQETLRRHGNDPRLHAILCDRDPGGIAEGRQLARRLGLTDQITFCQSDALDADCIAAAVATSGKTSVQIAIVSGLYELFPDNAPIANSLRGIQQVLDRSGQLLYTNQPWHPQQEMIARVLPNRDGDPWVMRCRSQAEMNRLVEEAGLCATKTLVDGWGIFSVSLAKRISKLA